MALGGLKTGGTAVHAARPNARSPMWNPRPSTLPLWPEFAEVPRKSQLVWSPWAFTLNQGMWNPLALPYSIRSDPDSSLVEDLGTPQVHWKAIRENGGIPKVPISLITIGSETVIYVSGM